MNENQVEPNDLPPWNGARLEVLFVYRRTNVSIEGSRLFFDEREMPFSGRRQGKELIGNCQR
jgi:hypothetical protein